MGPEGFLKLACDQEAPRSESINLQGPLQVRVWDQQAVYKSKRGISGLFLS